MWVVFADYGFVKPISLITACVFSAIVTLPIDNIRTRVYQQHLDPQKNRINFDSYKDLTEKISKL